MTYNYENSRSFNNRLTLYQTRDRSQVHTSRKLAVFGTHDTTQLESVKMFIRVAVQGVISERKELQAKVERTAATSE